METKVIQLNKEQLEVLRLHVNGAHSIDTLSEYEFKKVDNKRIHTMWFGAKVFLGDDGETVIITGKRGEVNKVLYYVGGEGEESCLHYGDMFLYESEDLYERFSDKLESEETLYALEVHC